MASPSAHAVDRVDPQQSVVERVDTGALADIAMLRGLGCRCPLIAKAGKGVPFTGCNVSGDRAVCSKRLEQHAEQIGETAAALDRVLRG